ncbi:MAG: hypothetical protein PHH98_04515 [Candidatus Gracilibacteria bacterium]|nr:hypothetical protein [Candidatus Gracilibacteria bacterium]
MTLLLLSTSSLNGYGLHKIFYFAKNAGFDGIDLLLNEDNFDVWNEKYLESLCSEFGIKVLSITAPSKGLDDELVDRIISIGKYLNVQLITFSPPYFKDTNSTWFSKKLPKLKKEITSFSIGVKNVEPEFLLLVIPKYRNASLLDIKKITGTTCLDLSCIDGSSGLDILKAYKILGSSIKNIYLSDKHSQKSGLLPGTSGGGISYLPLESFLMKLKTTGYSGFISLKVNPTELGAGNDELVFQKFKEIIVYYKKYFLNYK